MRTEVVKIDSQADSDEVARRAGQVLIDGGLVAFPTETVYGVAARADRPAAVDRLRTVKSRQPDHAFTVHISAPPDAQSFAPGLEGLAARFVRKGWPGPLTLILQVDDPSSAPVMARLNGAAVGAIYYNNMVGLRCPDDSAAEALLCASQAPIIAASANQTGNPPPITGDDVLRELDGRIDLLVDAGRTRYARPSTIVRVAGSSYSLLREGVYDAGIVKRMSTLNVLLVCTGNTCRSPMAAGVARKMLARQIGCSVEELPARGVEVRSAGTAGGGGGASSHAVTVMARRGVDLSDHTSVRLEPEMIRQADHILVMTRAHREMVVSMVQSCADRVVLLCGDQDIQDPIGGSEDDYERCARRVEEGLEVRLQEIIL